MWLVLAMIAPTDVDKLDDNFLPERVGMVSIIMYGKHFGYCPIYDDFETALKYFPDSLDRIIKLPIYILGEDDGDKEPA